MSLGTTPFIMIRDINGYNGFGISNSNNNVNTTLSANDKQSTTAPSDYAYYLAIFSYQVGATVFVSSTGKADTPGGAFASSPCAINPVAWLVPAGATIEFITADTSAYVTVSYYSLPNYGTASI